MTHIDKVALWDDPIVLAAKFSCALGLAVVVGWIVWRQPRSKLERVGSGILALGVIVLYLRMGVRVEKHLAMILFEALHPGQSVGYWPPWPIPWAAPCVAAMLALVLWVRRRSGERRPMLDIR